MKRISSINGFDWQPLRLTGLDFDAMKAKFGEPFTDDPGFPEPVEVWLFQWPCGLEVAIIYAMVSQKAFVGGDLPECGHLLRHLDWPGEVAWRLDEHPEEFENYRKSASDELIGWENTRLPRSELQRANIQTCSEWNFAARWRVMRQDDNGFRDVVASVNGERDARCLQAELESHGHKQMYWVERAPDTTSFTCNKDERVA